MFAEEPNVPTELCGLDNVVLLPHVGGATVRGVRAMTELMLRNLDQFLTHGTLTTPVVQANGHRRNVITDNRSRMVLERANDAVG